MIRSRYNPNRIDPSVADEDLGAGASPAGEVLRDHPDRAAVKPPAWLTGTANKLRSTGETAAFVVLTGGADLVGFRLRVAQSHARADLLPSCFDHSALLVARGDEFVAYHVPMRHLVVREAAENNGIRREDDLRALASSWRQTPNLALLRFPIQSVDEVEAAAQDLSHSRLSDDYLTRLSIWLGFIWGVQDGSHNPLLAAVSIPSAAFVEACFARARQDITPGITTRVVSPESIWQARFWADRYREPTPALDASDAPHREPASALDASDAPPFPLGYFVLHQPAASLTWPHAETK